MTMFTGSKVGYVVSAADPFSGPRSSAFAAAGLDSLTSQRRTGPYVRFQQISAPKSPAYVPTRRIGMSSGPSAALRQRSARIVQVGGLPNVATI